MMKHLHAADEKLSRLTHLATEKIAPSTNEQQADATVVEEMHSVLAEHESQVNALRAHLRSKHKSQREQMMKYLHAADEKLSRLTQLATGVKAPSTNEQQADATVIEEMHSVLAEHESQVNAILAIQHTSNTIAPADGPGADRIPAVGTHSSRARLAAIEMWHTQSLKIMATNRFLKQEERKEPDGNGTSTEDVDVHAQSMTSSEERIAHVVAHDTRPRLPTSGAPSSRQASHAVVASRPSTRHLQLKVGAPNLSHLDDAAAEQLGRSTSTKRLQLNAAGVATAVTTVGPSSSVAPEVSSSAADPDIRSLWEGV
jgi:hypothetical protein